MAVDVACPAPGPLSVTASSAMYPAMKENADAFRARCPGALIQVQSTDSGTAIEELVQAGVADTQLSSTEAQRVKLAMTDDYAGKPAKAAGLGYWPVGVGVFAVVVNREAGVTRLYSQQLRRLFAGTLPKWDDADLGGGDTEVVLVSRDRGGTRDTEARDDDNLDVVPIDGYFPDKDAVAAGRYPFWAVEKLARYGPERPPTVRDHFVERIRPPAGRRAAGMTTRL